MNTQLTTLHYSDIAALSEAIRQKKLSPVELVSGCLERIQQLNPLLNAFITVTAEEALKEARIAEREIQEGGWKGPLHGIPIAVKDMFDTAGIRTTAAFHAFAGRVPARDAEVVTRVKAAGAILVGKTNMHELAMGTTSAVSYFGSVHNPWNGDYIAGGSSGGSSVAIAAGLCYATIDTDAIGSCRLPAACCGTVGFKPTYGSISSKGILEGQEAGEPIILLSHTSFQCRSIKDAAILYDVLAHAQASPHSFLERNHSLSESPGNLRIGIVKNFKATKEIKTAFQRAVDTFRSLGFATSDIEAPLLLPAFDPGAIKKARQTDTPSLFGEADAWILPTTTDTTPSLEEAKAQGPTSLSPENTFFGNYYGVPVLSLPCGFDTRGLPIGLQIAAPAGKEDTILVLADAFQQATRWQTKHPII